MSLIKSLVIRGSADFRGFTADVLKATSAIEALDKAALATQKTRGRPSAAMPTGATATASVPAASAATEGSGEIGAALGQSSALIGRIGPQMQAAFSAALIPLHSFIAQFSDQFNRLGGTLTTLARRIDGAIKFPAAQVALNKLQLLIKSQIASASTVAVGDLSRLQRAVLALGPAAVTAVGAFAGFLKIRTFLGSIGDVAARPLQGLSKFTFAAPIGGASRLASEFRTMAPAVNRVTQGVRGLGLQIGLAFGVVGLVYKGAQAIASFFTSGIKGATDLGETMSKTKEVFGASTAEVVSSSTAMATAFGLPKGAILDAASSFGLIAKGSGLSVDASAKLSNELTQLAADASSFYNVPLDVSLEKIRSGLVGEAVPLRQFGVLLSEEAVKLEAAAMGLTKHKGVLDEQSKVAARASLIQKGLATASGDLARTQDSAANQFRKAGGGIANFATTIGELLMPAIQSGIVSLNEFMASMIEAFESNRPMITEWAEHLTGAVDFVGVIVRNFADVWKIVQLSATESLANVVAYVDVLGPNLSILADYVANNWSKLIIDSVMAIGHVFKNLLLNIGDFSSAVINYLKNPMEGFTFEWTPMLEGFKATAAEFPELLKPELVSMRDEIDEVMSRISGKEAARTASLGKDVPKPAVPGEAKVPETGDKYKGTAAVALGSSEATSAIAKFRNQGAGSDQNAKLTASNTTIIADEAKKTTNALDQILRIASGDQNALAVFNL